MGVDAGLHSGAAAPALVNILQIVAVANGQPVNSNLEAKINADAAVIKTLAGDFAKASSSAAPTVCSQLQAAISTYQADQQLVLSAAQVSDLNTQTKITLLAGLVADTVQSIAAVIPACQANGQTFKAAPRTVCPRLLLITTAFLWLLLGTRLWMRLLGSYKFISTRRLCGRLPSGG